MNRVMLLCGTDKQAEAMDACANMVRPPIENNEQNAILRATVGTQILAELSCEVQELKKSPAASEAPTL